jgi:hypothetical protein
MMLLLLLPLLPLLSLLLLLLLLVLVLVLLLVLSSLIINHGVANVVLGRFLHGILLTALELSIPTPLLSTALLFSP